MLACKAAEQVYEAVVFAFAHDGHWVEIGAGAGAGAAAGAKLAAAVAVELPVPVAGAGLEAGPGLEAEAEAELGDEVETAHMKKSAAVLGLMAEGQLASEIGHPVGRVAVDIEHSVDIAADKGHSHGTSDSTAGIAIVVAAGSVVAVVKTTGVVTEEVAAGSAVGVAAEAAGVARAAVVVVALAAEAVDAGAAEEATLGSWETACDDVVEA
ncbi:hypothetical protein OPV22_017212 [Ensete ventricosum]|uniref:Uncharacterized protein n=1 Tax=Ensete ventricosum TaxID=4639 RepID=A0AAV8QRM2_ENSVE|nr:hypothetical protein OPV22_017212 [Ensete ventricosum]